MPAVNPTPRLGPNQTGYILIQAPIVGQLRDAFVARVNTLVGLGAREVYVLIASPGGVWTVAQDIINFVDATQADRGIRFTMHNVGVVASAACYIFLAGQRRLAVPGSAFVFHEASIQIERPGRFTSQSIQDASNQVQQIERQFLDTLRRRTRLTAGEASSFVRRTVILDPAEAQRDGIIEAISGLPAPQGATLFRLQAASGQGNPTGSRPPAAPSLP